MLPSSQAIVAGNEVNYVNTTESVTLKPLNRDGKIAVASSVTVFVVASVLFFVVGFLCGYFFHKKKKMFTVSETILSTGEGTQQVTNTDGSVLDQELELKDNVAYGPVRSSTSQPVPLYEDIIPSVVQR